MSNFYDDVENFSKKKPRASTFNIKDAVDDENEERDTDSVVSCDEFKHLSDCYDNVLQSNLKVMIKEEDDTELCASDAMSNWSLQTGLEDDIDFYKVPEDWNPPKKRPGEPKFEKVDNPGKWPHFCFRANGKGKLLFVCFLFLNNYN